MLGWIGVTLWLLFWVVVLGAGLAFGHMHGTPAVPHANGVPG